MSPTSVQMSVKSAGSDTRLSATWVSLVRAVWAILVLSCVGLFIATMVSVATDSAMFQAIVVGGMGIEPFAFRAGLDTTGISSRIFTTYALIVVTAIALSCITLASILVRLRSNDWLVLLISLSYVAYGTGYIYIISPFPTTNVWPAPLNVFARFLTLYCGVILYLVFWFLFPDGRFRPRWTRWFGVFLLLFGLYWVFGFEENPFSSQATGFEAVGLVLGISIILSAVPAQVYRYLRFSSPIERQQTKWAVAGFSIALIGNVILNLPRLLEVSWIQSDVSAIAYSMATFILSAILVLTALVALVIAILRYRLWDIDIIIRRTLIYGTLSVTLTLIFFVSVALIQVLIPARSELVTVLSTLLVAALFTPLRHRVQNGIDRRFYRKNYDAGVALSEFGALIRDEVDLDRISNALIVSAADVMQPGHISLWLKDRDKVQ